MNVCPNCDVKYVVSIRNLKLNLSKQSNLSEDVIIISVIRYSVKLHDVTVSNAVEIITLQLSETRQSWTLTR